MSGGRPVDHAMEEEYLDKETVRSLWLEHIRAVAQQNPDSNEPWYLTLPGASGRDIQRMIDDGLIGITEANTIAEEDQERIVAVENSNQAIASLQRRFIGLRIVEVPFQNLVAGEGRFAWPGSDEERICRAHVINLDLNAPLKGKDDHGRIVFPVIAWISKLCQLHGKRPRLDWTLFLTLHGELVLSPPANRFAHQFLLENIDREADFAEGCRRLWGNELWETVTGGGSLEYGSLGLSAQQRLSMSIVPKLIAHHVHLDGWMVETERNLGYGGNGRARMATWIIHFTWDEDAASTPDRTYREAMKRIFVGFGYVSNDGELVSRN